MTEIEMLQELHPDAQIPPEIPGPDARLGTKAQEAYDAASPEAKRDLGLMHFQNAVLAEYREQRANVIAELQTREAAGARKYSEAESAADVAANRPASVVDPRDVYYNGRRQEAEQRRAKRLQAAALVYQRADLAQARGMLESGDHAAARAIVDRYENDPHRTIPHGRAQYTAEIRRELDKLGSEIAAIEQRQAEEHAEQKARYAVEQELAKQATLREAQDVIKAPAAAQTPDLWRRLARRLGLVAS